LKMAWVARHGEEVVNARVGGLLSGVVRGFGRMLLCGVVAPLHALLLEMLGSRNVAWRVLAVLKADAT
jgi:hypothetical protein